MRSIQHTFCLPDIKQLHEREIIKETLKLVNTETLDYSLFTCHFIKTLMYMCVSFYAANFIVL